MPYDQTHRKYYEEIYGPALERSGFIPVKADAPYSTNPVIEDIKKLISACDLILCEISGNNPNVFYELGLAHAIGKPAVLISRSEKEIPFDLKSMRVIIYDNSDIDWASKLRRDIEKASTEASSAPVEKAKPLIGTGESADGVIPGLVKTFKNLASCEQEILEQIKTSLEIKIFFYLGKTILAGSQKSIYDNLEKSVNRESKIRILHSGEKNKYLTRRISLERDSNQEGWISDIKYAKEKIENLKKRSRALVRSRTHGEAYYWTIFIFDKFAYVQPYIHQKNNTEKSAVLKVEKTGEEGSMYNLYDTFFERKWDESTPTQCDIDEIIGGHDELAQEGKISVSARILFNDLYLFVTPRRYVDEKNGVVYFHSPGGKIGDGEGYINAIKREIKEEIDCLAEIATSEKTFLLSDHSDIGEVFLCAPFSPKYLYRSPKNNPNLTNSNTSKLWTLGYEAVLAGDSKPKPQKEIFAILMLSKIALKSSIERRLKVRDIMSASDGSKLITSIGVSLKPHWTIEPRGLARIIASMET